MNRGYSLVQLEQCFDPVNNVDLEPKHSASRAKEAKSQPEGTSWVSHFALKRGM